MEREQIKPSKVKSICKRDSHIGLIEFTEASITPTSKGEYLVIDDTIEYVLCAAHFTDDGEFCFFAPKQSTLNQRNESAQKIYRTKVLPLGKNI